MRLILFLSLLSLLALAASLALVVMMVVPSLRPVATREFSDIALPAALVIALVASLGSLYMSEVEGFVPCLLCWVQRGLMYPLVPILAWLVFRFGKALLLVALASSAGGVMVSLYHYGEQQRWWGGSEDFCSAEVPCTFMWVEQFGFMSIPFMSFTGFCLIAMLLLLRLMSIPQESGSV